MEYGSGFTSYGDNSRYEDYGSGYDNEGSQGGYMGATEGSQQTPRKGNREQQSLMPLTLKQINTLSKDQPDDVFRIDGKEISRVKVIGMILDIQQNSTSMTLRISDGTAAYEVRKFIRGEEAEIIEEIMSSFREGLYVRVIGNLRSYNEVTSIGVDDIRLVTDFNEITCHFLDCVYTHLINTRGPLLKKDVPGMALAGNMHTPIKSGSGMYSSAPSFHTPTQQLSGMSMDTDSNFTPEQSLLLQVMSDCISDTGLSISEILRRLNGRLSEAQARDAIQYLTNEGHVYSTIDDDHFRRTE